MHGLRGRFAALVAAAPNDLARPALEIARIVYPELDPAPTLDALDALAHRAQPAVADAPDAAAAADALARVLFVDAGLRGNTDEYYDPRNSLLNDVVGRGLGIPITLSVVMLEVARRCRIPLDGISFPGHFLVATGGTRERVFFDPFHGGVRLSHQDLLARLHALADPGNGGPVFSAVPPEFLTASPPPTILARMLRNLLRIWQQTEQTAPALAAVDLLLVLTPDAPDELRTRGLLYADLECFAAAAADLRRYLHLAPDAADAAEVRRRLSRLADFPPTLH